MPTLPGIGSAAPIHANQEDSHAGGEESDTYPVQSLELLNLRLASYMKHFLLLLGWSQVHLGGLTYVRWRMIEHVVQQDR